MWFNLAAAASKTKKKNLPAEYRDRVTAKMTPAQIAEAQKLAREWKPKPLDPGSDEPPDGAWPSVELH